MAGTGAIPKNRAFVDEILKTVGLSHNDTKGIIDVCKGLSLNDSYWGVPADFYDFAETDDGSRIVNIMHPG